MSTPLIEEAETSRRAGSRQVEPLRIAINLLTEDPRAPSGAHWFWTRTIPEMAKRLEPNEELHLLVSPRSRDLHAGYRGVHYITYPWSNERRNLRAASEHLYSPVRLPLSRIDILDTLIAPVVNPRWSLVIHMKTMHAYTQPESLTFASRAYRRIGYPRSTRLAEVIIVNSRSIRSEIERYLDVDPEKFRLIYSAVDHDLFTPGNADAARADLVRHGITRPFVLFVSALWPYKNCHGLLHAFARAKDRLQGRQIAVVGAARDTRYAASLRTLAAQLGLADDVVFVGAVSLEETVNFYRAADVLVYPSMNETFGLPIVEAMACGCPVVTSKVSSMPEVAGGAAVLCDPCDPDSIMQAIIDALGARNRLRDLGIARAREFSWGATAAAHLDVYREVGERRRRQAAPRVDRR